MPNLVRLVLAASLALLGDTAHAQGAESAVSRPDVKPGDTWTYRRMDYWKNAPLRTFRLEVTFADRGVIQLLASGPGGNEFDTTWTSDWNAVSTPVGTYEPAQQLLKFPLQVGNEYKAAWEIATRPHGMRESHERKVRVVGWEDVVVPAGKFRALKIEAEGTFQVRHYARSGTARHLIWYVPEVKRWVKLVYEDVIMLGGPQGPNAKTGEELVSYSVK